MKNSSHASFETADTLRGDWSVLDELDVDSSLVKQRSEVFQRVLKADDRTIPVYVKIYSYRKHPLQRIGRRGRSSLEARNLIFFNEIGIPAANLIEWSERRNAIGRITEEYLITETISSAVPLAVFVNATCPNRDEVEYRQRRDIIIQQLGTATRRIHQSNFLHRDLKWRNVLARLAGNHVETYWIDCPAGSFSQIPVQLKRGKLKDCATLDKVARQQCTSIERRQFAAAYADLPINAPELDTLCTNIEHYREKRFDKTDAKQALRSAND